MLKLLLINASFMFEVPLVPFPENSFSGISIIFEYALILTNEIMSREFHLIFDYTSQIDLILK